MEAYAQRAGTSVQYIGQLKRREKVAKIRTMQSLAYASEENVTYFEIVGHFHFPEIEDGSNAIRCFWELWGRYSPGKRQARRAWHQDLDDNDANVNAIFYATEQEAERCSAYGYKNAGRGAMAAH